MSTTLRALVIISTFFIGIFLTVGSVFAVGNTGKRSVDYEKERKRIGSVVQTSSGYIVVQPKNYANQKVVVTKSTLVVDKADLKALLNSFKVGDRVRIKGMEDRGTNTITELTQIKNFSLPRVGTSSGVDK